MKKYITIYSLSGDGMDSRKLWIAIRQAILIVLGAIEDYLGAAQLYLSGSAGIGWAAFLFNPCMRKIEVLD